MDGSGGGLLWRVRRLESCFEASVRSRGPAKPRPGDAVGQRSPRPAAGADFVDDDRWITVVLSVVRIVVCFLSMAVTTAVWAVIMLLLLPWPYARIRQGNLYGHVTGRMLVRNLSCCFSFLFSFFFQYIHICIYFWGVFLCKFVVPCYCLIGLFSDLYHILVYLRDSIDRFVGSVDWDILV